MSQILAHNQKAICECGVELTSLRLSKLGTRCLAKRLSLARSVSSLSMFCGRTGAAAQSHSRSARVRATGVTSRLKIAAPLTFVVFWWTAVKNQLQGLLRQMT